MARSVHKALVGLFAASILTLAALVVHWTVLLWQHESSALSEAEQSLIVAAHRAAQDLGRRDRPPRLGPLTGEPRLEVLRLGAEAGVESAAGQSAGRTVRLSPRFAGYGIRPSPAVVKQLRSKRRRRFLMLLGEGGLALVLFLVFCVVLLRLLYGERQRRREIEAFINTISHELKTPLAGIKALLGTLQMGNIPAERMNEYLDMGLRESDRLEHLVENILIANRIRRSTLAVRLKDLDLGPFLVEYLDHRNALLPVDHPGVHLVEDPPDGLLVRADGDKLRVVLENLTDNAIKYGDSSRVRFEVEARADRVHLVVADDGIGFAPEGVEALFEGLRAATQEDAAMVHGTGLGLGIARKLARTMDGEVRAQSPGPGKGSRFTVELRRSELRRSEGVA
jgi:signal transduction histidine kinase